MNIQIKAPQNLGFLRIKRSQRSDKAVSDIRKARMNSEKLLKNKLLATLNYPAVLLFFGHKNTESP